MKSINNQLLPLGIIIKNGSRGWGKFSKEEEQTVFYIEGYSKGVMMNRGFFRVFACLSLSMSLIVACSETEIESPTENSAHSSSANSAVSSSVNSSTGSELNGLTGNCQTTSTTSTLYVDSDPTCWNYSIETASKVIWNDSNILEIKNWGKCSSEGSFSMTQDTSVQWYHLGNDSLYLWREHDCFAEVYYGDYDRIDSVRWREVGTTDIPIQYQKNNQDCPESNPVEYESGENLNTFITLTSSSAQFSLSWEICLAEVLLDSFEGEEALDCSRIRLPADSGTYIITFREIDMSNEHIVSDYTYNGITCTENIPPWLGATEESCREAWQLFQEQAEPVANFWYEGYNDRALAWEEFENCKRENGFPE